VTIPPLFKGKISCVMSLFLCRENGVGKDNFHR
jgi:hypothetical protein